MLICFVNHNLVKIWTHIYGLRCDMNNYHLYSISEEISMFNIIRIRFAPYSTHIYLYSYRSNPHSYLYPSLSVFISESDRKCKNKYNISDICPYPYLLAHIKSTFSCTPPPSLLSQPLHHRGCLSSEPPARHNRLVVAVAC